MPPGSKSYPVREMRDDDGDTGCGGCGTCCGQFCALVRKNTLVTRRSWCQLLIELLVPAIIILLLGALRGVIDPQTFEEVIPHSDTPLPSWDLLLKYTSYPNVLCYDNNMFLRCDCHDDDVDDPDVYHTGLAVNASGPTMFSLLHSEDPQYDICISAAKILVDGSATSLVQEIDGGCTLYKLVSYLCGELIGGEIFLDSLESFGEYCEDDEVVEDPSAFEYLQTFEDAAILSETLSATFNYIIPEDDIDSVCQTLNFGVMNSDNSDEVGDGSVADTFYTYMTSTYPETADRFLYYETESEFEDIISSSSYSQEAPSEDVIGFSAGIVFSSGSPDWSYTIRSNLTKSARGGFYYMMNVPITSSTTENNCKSPEDCPDTDGSSGDISPWTSMYHQSPSLILQGLVDSWIMMQEGVDDVDITVRLSEFPSPSYEDDGFWSGLNDFFAILVVISVLYPIACVISILVKEKELRIKEGLRMMGLSSVAHTGSWIFHFVIRFFCISLLMVLLSTELFKFSDQGLIFLYFFLFFLSTTAFCFCVAAFFSRARTASTIGTMIFFVALFPFYALEGSNVDPGSRRAGCLLPPTCLALGTLSFVEYEDSEEGVTPDTAGTSEDGFTFYDVLFMFVIDIVIYSILAWYLGNVVPSEWGTSRKPWFIFTSSYWCPGSASKTAMEDSRSLLEHFESEGKETVEPAADELKTQISTNECVAIRGLTKEYKNATGGSKIAVDGLDLTMYSGQITALLGHNGAGKTTTIGMLTGMIPVTSGVAFVGGKNVEVDMTRIRKTLGVCPQHDILFPTLTVREHLRMYAVIKGVPAKDLSNVIRATLADVGLTEKENELTKTLSGGQKRKLSVGIALIGGSRVVFLDEPTSGMDPHSRRFTWELIRKNREGRVIVLTTHFMDEADLLGDRVAIMADGALRCCGSSLFLKNLYGVGYNLTIVRSFGSDRGESKLEAPVKVPEGMEDGQRENVKLIKRLVASHVPAAGLLSNVGAEISFQLPNDASPAFKGLLSEVDTRKDELSITSYGMSVTTLEEVFLRVANGTADANSRNTIAKIGLQRQSSLSSTMKNAATAEVGAGVGSKKASHGYIRSTNLFGAHMKALLQKRYLTFRRDKKMWIFVVIVPALFVLLGIIILESITTAEEPSLVLTPQDYNDGDGAPLPYANTCTLNVSKCSPGDLMDYIDDTGSADPVTLEFVNATSDAAVEALNAELVDLTYDDKVYGAVSFRKANTEDMEFDYTSNYSALHGVPVYMNQINSAILRFATGNDALSISVTMHPMPQTEYQKDIAAGFDSLTATLFILIAFSFVPAAWITYVVREKETKCKHQQVVSGVSLDAYWVTSFLWDLISLIIPAGFTIIILAAFDVKALISGEAAGATILLFLFFGLSMPSYTYLMSFFFKGYSAAQNTFLFHNWILGLILPIAVWVMNLFENTQDASKAMAYIFSLCPQYALGQGLLNMGFIVFFELIDEVTNYTPLDLRIAGLSLVYMGVCSVVYFVLVLLMERALAGSSWLSGMAGKLFMTRKLSSVTPRQLGEFDELDDDVAKETHRVTSGAAGTDAVRMEKLRKIYPTSGGAKVAVKSMSLGISKGECFGLLGINGAGKSSTLAMLSGELPPTSGSAFLADYDVRKNPEEIHRLVGYCPQFDALFETLTAREHLRLYGAIKGIPSDKLEEAVEEKIEEMGLRQYCERPAGGYSGGNKRKLSVAIAMIGDPQIVFLDEPSTGMDPVARRFMWNVIMRIVTENRECAMILTTHSMEECEALCQRIGIMVGGRLRCLGSSQHLKTRFGKGFQLEIRIAPIATQETEEMMATIGKSTNGQGNLGDSQALTAALAAAEAPELAGEITATGRGTNIFHALATQRYVTARDYASWVCLEKKCSRVISFVEESFHGSIMREKQNAKMRFEFPQQAQHTLADLFGFLEDNREALSIGEYSLSQTSLEQIFNGFAAKQEEEQGHAAGIQ